MSTTDLEQIEVMSGEDYVVQVFKRTSRSVDAEQWERADALRDAVARDSEGLAGARPCKGVNDGSHAVLTRYWERLTDESDIKEDLLVGTLAQYRSVSLAWPEEKDRFKEASFEAHKELAPRAYDGKRATIMRRLVDRSSKRRVSRNDVRVWKSHQNPKPVERWEDRIERRLRSLVLGRDMKPAGPNERAFLVKLLYQLARETEDAGE